MIILGILIIIIFVLLFGIFMAELVFNKPALTEAFVLGIGITFFGIAVCLLISLL